jgi:hypothetical protein
MWILESARITSHSIAAHWPKLYDEFVGQLLDDGLNIEDAGWLKPVYGNQNLLWTCDAGIGKRRAESLLRSMKEFSPEVYEFKQGEVKIANRRWMYLGYTDRTNGTDSPWFQSFVFVCGPGASSDHLGVRALRHL